MDVQKFGNQTLNIMDGLLGEMPGQAKKKGEQGEFQQLLGQLGLSAAMLDNLQMPPAMLAGTAEEKPACKADILAALPGQWNEPGEMAVGKHQMEKLLFLNYQNQGENQMENQVENKVDAGLTQFGMQMTAVPKATADEFQNMAVSGPAYSLPEMPDEGIKNQKTFSARVNGGGFLEPDASEQKKNLEYASVNGSIETGKTTENRKSQETVSPEEAFLTEKNGVSNPNSVLSRERLIKRQPEEKGYEPVLASDVGQNPQIRDYQNRSNISEVPSYATVTVKDEAKMPDMLGEIVQKAVSAGRTELEIQLEPEHLGKISIKVLTDDRQTVISLCCTEEKTRQLLAQNAKELGAIMENNLGTTPQILVEKQASDYLQRENQQGGQQHQEQHQERQQQKQPEREADDFLQKLRISMLSTF